MSETAPLLPPPGGFRNWHPWARFAIYAALIGGPIVILQIIAHFLAPAPAQAARAAASTSLSPLLAALGEVFALGWTLLVTVLMMLLEKRRFKDFGLPGRDEVFGARFWQGVMWGIASLSLLLGFIALNGDFSFGQLAIHGPAVAEYGAGWGLAFLIVGFFEEITFRAYPLVTLTQATGFWPAAIIMSVLFGAIHLGNLGEDWLGAVSAGLIGLFFCFTFRRTGSLWFAIGLHTSWDWCESFLYGVPDSGTISKGRLLVPSFHGSHWITGGAVGPEGSVWVLVVIGLLFAAFARWTKPAAATPFDQVPRASSPSAASSAA